MITDEIKSKYLRDIEYFSKKVEELPNSKYYYPLAFAYLQLQKYDNVIEVCEKGLDKYPDYLQLATLMGDAFLKKGLQEEAKAIFESIIKKDQHNFKSFKLLGDICREENNIEKALQYYKRAYELSPGSEELEKILSELNALEKPEELAYKEDDKYSIDADLDKIIDDVFKNVNIEHNEEGELKDSIGTFALEDSLNMINELSEKSKNIDKIMQESDYEDPNELILKGLQRMLENIEKLKKERQLD